MPASRVHPRCSPDGDCSYASPPLIGGGSISKVDGPEKKSVARQHGRAAGMGAVKGRPTSTSIEQHLTENEFGHIRHNDLRKLLDYTLLSRHHNVSPVRNCKGKGHSHFLSGRRDHQRQFDITADCMN